MIREEMEKLKQELKKREEIWEVERKELWKGIEEMGR